MKQNIAILTILASLFFSPLKLNAQAVDRVDSMALVDLYTNTNGPNWNIAEPWLNGPISNWTGIKLTQDGIHVKEVSLYFSNLKGEIPASLGNLSKCEFLDLSYNELKGTIPENLGNLNSVGSVFLGANQLTGEIPASLGYLPKLTWLELWSNKLRGTIPESFVSTPNLTILKIDNNKFTYAGMEKLVQRHLPTFSYDNQDTIFAIKRKNDKFYVASGGGTLQKTAYLWQRPSDLDTTIIGDSTFVPRKTGTYRVFIYDSIVTGLNFHSEFKYATTIEFLDPNQSLSPLINEDGSIGTYVLNNQYYKTVHSAATDGSTKLLVVSNSTTPVIYSIAEGDSGMLSSLTAQNIFSKKITIEPDGIGRTIVVYTVPDGYGEINAINKFVDITVARDNDTIGHNLIGLIKPPVVLVHGMWSSPDVWEKGGFIKALHNAGFTNIFAADYSAFNATTFNPASPASLPGRGSVEAAVKEALAYCRSLGAAVTQVDVVGHSLGGLMTRSWSQQIGFKKVDNFQKGYVHKLITLGTPHRGSPLGSELVASQNNLIRIPLTKDTIPVSLGFVLALAGMPVGSCHADFGVTSPGIIALNATPPYYTYSIIGDQTGQLAGYLGFTVAALAAFNHTYAEVFKAHDPCTNTLEHDLVVPLSSQRGYIPSTEVFVSTGHSTPAFNTETNSPLVQAKVISLLLSDNPADFSKGFPAPSLFPLDCTTANQRVSPSSSSNKDGTRLTTLPGIQRIKIISPLTGTTYKQNGKASIKLQYEAVEGAKAFNCVFMVEGLNWFTITDSATNSVSFTLPDNSTIGKLRIVLIGRDSSGYILGDTVHINITPDGGLDSLAIEPSLVKLDSSLRERSVYVHGYYTGSNGNFIDNNFSSNSTGTTYLSKIGNIFNVTKDGLLIAKGIGTDTLIVTNNGKTVKAAVVVDNNFAEATLYDNLIDFPLILDKNTNDTPFALNATATSGDAITYTVISGPAVISNNVVALTGLAGNVTISATVSSNPYFKTATSVTRSFVVSNNNFYTFIGNGNWSNSANWSNNLLPPTNLVTGKITIDPIINGECILDVNQTISSGANLTIATGKRFKILGGILIQE